MCSMCLDALMGSFMLCTYVYMCQSVFFSVLLMGETCFTSVANDIHRHVGGHGTDCHLTIGSGCGVATGT